MLVRDGLLAAVALLALGLACTSSTPPPEPQRSPAPTLPSCVTDADCSAGEECREGECLRHGVDEGESGGCPQGCGPGQICADGVCVGRIDADDGGTAELPCGGCPEGQTCEVDSGLCQPSARPDDAGVPWEER
ncbi:MAG TPA: hypothetical protein VM925_23445 [Labilithrix sp.]|nr:hypothetical protein [Labilithrix sp.]